MYDHDLRFSTASELVECFFDDGVFEPKSLFDVSERGTAGYLFRGQSDGTLPLLPVAHRSTTALRDYTPQPPPAGPISEDRRRQYLGSHLHAELRAVGIFLEEADRLGISTPLDFGLTARHTKTINDALNGRPIDPESTFPDPADLPSMALAQHHGIPTRLLDWTESPLVGAYFAAINASSAAFKERTETDFSVLCLSLWFLRHTKSIRAVVAPRHANAFLRSQRGMFTYITCANNFYLDHGRWPSIEDIVAEERSPTTEFVKPALIRLTLPASEADDLLRLLFRHGITRHQLMPSLENAAAAHRYKMALYSRQLPD